jgi:hypothetical protein
MGWGFIGGLLPGMAEENRNLRQTSAEVEEDNKPSEAWMHWLANKLATNRGELAPYPYGARPDDGPALSDSQIFNRKYNESMRGGLSPIQAGTGMEHRLQPPAPAPSPADTTQPQAKIDPLMQLVKSGMRGKTDLFQDTKPSSGPRHSPMVDRPTTGFMMSPTPTTRDMAPLGQLQSARRNRNG